jgi:hypothetical protein
MWIHLTDNSDQWPAVACKVTPSGSVKVGDFLY